MKRLSKWLFCSLLLVLVAACGSERTADDSVDLSSDVASALEAIHRNGSDPTTVASQMESLTLLDSGGPDEYGWAFSSVTTVPGIKDVSVEFQLDAPGVDSEWSLLTVRIVLDSSADAFAAVTSKLGTIFDENPVELSATKPRRTIWQMSDYREVLVSETPDQGDTRSGRVDSIVVEYGIAQGEAE